MSIIFFLWFWTMELLAITSISVIVGLIVSSLPKPEPESEDKE